MRKASALASRGDVDGLRGLIARFGPCDPSAGPKASRPYRLAASAAAEKGHAACLDLLLREARCATEVHMGRAAALGGHLDCLKLLVLQGCPLDYATLVHALRGVSIGCVDYVLREGGAGIVTPSVLAAAAARSSRVFDLFLAPRVWNCLSTRIKREAVLCAVRFCALDMDHLRRVLSLGEATGAVPARELLCEEAARRSTRVLRLVHRPGTPLYKAYVAAMRAKSRRRQEWCAARMREEGTVPELVRDIHFPTRTTKKCVDLAVRHGVLAPSFEHLYRILSRNGSPRLFHYMLKAYKVDVSLMHGLWLLNHMLIGVWLSQSRSEALARDSKLNFTAENHYAVFEDVFSRCPRVREDVRRMLRDGTLDEPRRQIYVRRYLLPRMRRTVRWMVAVRPYAWHVYSEVQRVKYAPGKRGREEDLAAFETDADLDPLR